MKERIAIKQKKKKVEEIKKAVLEYSMFGVVNMENLPTYQLQKMKYKMQDVKLMMVKKRLIKRAFEELKDQKNNLDQVLEKLRGMPALLFSNDNPFKLFKTLKASKSYAPMKAGQVAPNDIVINAGPTDFTPGPIIGELGRLGLKTAVEDGKIAIQEDAVVVKEGDVVDGPTADMLTKMNIEPMEIGLNLVMTYENGEVLTKDVLDIDEDVYLNNVKLAASDAYNLSIGIVYLVKENINRLISKAASEASFIADKFEILTSENVGKFLAKAEAEMMNLKIKLPDLESEESKTEEQPTQEAPKEEAPVEEQPTAEQSEEQPAEESAETPQEEAPAEEKQEDNIEIEEINKAEEAPVEAPQEEAPAQESIEEPQPEESVEETPAEPEVEEPAEEPEQSEEEPKEEAPVEEKKEEVVKDKEEPQPDFKDKEKQAQDFIKSVTDQIIKG